MQWDAYSDETPVDSDTNLLLPSLFLEEAGTKGPWSWIAGLRAEKPVQLLPGSPLPTTPILAPRLNFKYALSPTWDARFNMGRGYRRIHLFTEEHAALNGSRQIVIEQPLTPERSWNGHLSTHRTFGHADALADIGMHAFATRFAHQLVADYNAQPDAIVYRNIPGTGWTRGVGADLQASWRATWTATLGATLLRAYVVDGPEASTRELEFAPRWTTRFDCGWRHGPWSVQLQGQTTGHMRLPVTADLPLYSPTYHLVHASFSRQCGRHGLRWGWKNLTNTSQPTPIIAAEAPFSESFDASRVYGPIEGRRAYFQWTWTLP